MYVGVHVLGCVVLHSVINNVVCTHVICAPYTTHITLLFVHTLPMLYAQRLLEFTDMEVLVRMHRYWEQDPTVRVLMCHDMPHVVR